MSSTDFQPLSLFNDLYFDGRPHIFSDPSQAARFYSIRGLTPASFIHHAKEFRVRIKNDVFGLAQSCGLPVLPLSSDYTYETVYHELSLRLGRTVPGLLFVGYGTERVDVVDARSSAVDWPSLLTFSRRNTSHFYLLYSDPAFGLVSIRLLTFPPYSMRVHVNIMQWLAKTLAAAGEPAECSGDFLLSRDPGTPEFLFKFPADRLVSVINSLCSLSFRAASFFEGPFSWLFSQANFISWAPVSESLPALDLAPQISPADVLRFNSLFQAAGISGVLKPQRTVAGPAYPGFFSAATIFSGTLAEPAPPASKEEEPGSSARFMYNRSVQQSLAQEIRSAALPPLRGLEEWSVPARVILGLGILDGCSSLAEIYATSLRIRPAHRLLLGCPQSKKSVLLPTCPILKKYLRVLSSEPLAPLLIRALRSQQCQGLSVPSEKAIYTTLRLFFKK